MIQGDNWFMSCESNNLSIESQYSSDKIFLNVISIFQYLQSNYLFSNYS